MDTLSSILGIGTAVPTHELKQEQALQFALEAFSFDEKQSEQVKKLFINSGINKRHVVIPDFLQPRLDRKFFYNYPETIPGMTDRNNLYKDFAPKLAHEAASKAIQSWGGDPADITHVISVSCTGAVVPGLEFSLMDSLKLKRSLYRLGINFMGCFGAFKGVEVAHAFSKANPNHRILVVCTELCSLQLQADLIPDNILANSLFADGAAAVVVGEARSNENALWNIISHYSYGLENSLSQMSWEASDSGFKMKLSNFVPLSLAKNIKPFIEKLLGNHTQIGHCNWAIHPGGKAILQVIEKKLNLPRSSTQPSWNILEQFGNMSSATFLFVLENLLAQPNTHTWTAGVGFGPGLSMEGLLLKMS